MPSCTWFNPNRETSVQRPSQPVDAVEETCPLLQDDICVRVVLYDPLADAEVYGDWGFATDVVAVETAAAGVRCIVDGHEHTVDDSEIRVEGLECGSFVEVEFPDFSVAQQEIYALRPNEDPRPYISVVTEDGCFANDTRDELAVPHVRPFGGSYRYRCRVGATYTVRIWLRPKCIVLHWSGMPRGENFVAPRLCYHFRVTSNLVGPEANATPGTEEVQWRCGHQSGATDPRFWRHNLYIAGVPAVPGAGVDVAASRGIDNIGPAPRRRSYWWNSQFNEPDGFGVHAFQFNVNSVGVNLSSLGQHPVGTLPTQGIANSADQLGQVIAHTAMTSEQVNVLVARVAQLCMAWRLDPNNLKHVCTHFEVNYLHRGVYNSQGSNTKWDVTWLPPAFQVAYAQGHGDAELCAPANNRFRHRFYVDVQLGNEFGRFRCQDGTQPHNSPSGNANAVTDRVSACLRERITALV